MAYVLLGLPVGTVPPVAQDLLSAEAGSSGSDGASSYGIPRFRSEGRIWIFCSKLVLYAWSIWDRIKVLVALVVVGNDR